MAFFFFFFFFFLKKKKKKKKKTALTALSTILSRNDDAFRRVGETKAAAFSHCVFHVAPNQSTNSLWLKLTRLDTIPVDEPQRRDLSSEKLVALKKAVVSACGPNTERQHVLERFLRVGKCSR